MVILCGLMVFNCDLMGFYGDFMVILRGVMGLNGDLMAIF